MAAFPRIYTSFAQFEREELRKLDSLSSTVEDMLTEKFSQELDFSDDSPTDRRRRRRRNNLD